MIKRSLKEEKNNDKEPTSGDTLELQAELVKNNTFNSGSIVNRDGSKVPIYTYFIFEGSKKLLVQYLSILS